MKRFWKAWMGINPVRPLNRVLEAEYAPLRRELRQAGLNERCLRRMTPDERVAALERAKLDPYDYIYLACG